MKYVLISLLLVVGHVGGCWHSAAGQRADLYDCEGCEAIYETAFDDLSWSAAIPPADEPGEPLVLSGIVYAPDGRTPASDVVVYAHHTDAEGVYPTRGDEKGWGRRHGYLRGWVKTDASGRYRFETIRPGAYPGREAPEHIHLIVKEPDKPEYWIDDVVFEGDPLVTDAMRRRLQNRGGSGVVKLSRSDDGTWQAERDIILERHPD